MSSMMPPQGMPPPQGPPQGGMGQPDPQALQAAAAQGDPRAIALLQQLRGGGGGMPPGGPPPMGGGGPMSGSPDVEAAKAAMLLKLLKQHQG